MNPKLVIEQKITAFVNRYKVLNANDNSEAGQLVALAQQKRLAFKEKVSFYTDEAKSTVSFTFRAEKVLDVHGRYIVEDEKGAVIGMFRKEFKQSLVVSSWVLMDKDGNDIFRVQENNVTIAVMRRFLSFVPIIGDLLNLVMNFFRYHFAFIHIADGQEVGQFRKTTLLRDHYLLSMTDDAWNSLDSRVFAAMGVALDALQSR